MIVMVRSEGLRMTDGILIQYNQNVFMIKYIYIYTYIYKIRAGARGSQAVTKLNHVSFSGSRASGGLTLAV
jgi:hypothetical protein